MCVCVVVGVLHGKNRTEGKSKKKVIAICSAVTLSTSIQHQQYIIIYLLSQRY